MHCFQWDWKSEPEWKDINKALEGWEGPVVFSPVDTKNDSMGVILSKAKLSKKEAQKVWDNWIDSLD